jgi:FkbM family methyltransferase
MQNDQSFQACEDLATLGIPYFFDGKIRGALSWRIYAMRLFFAGRFSVKNVFNFIFLPTRYRRKEIEAINKCIKEDTQKYFQEHGLYERGEIELRSHSAVPASSTATGWLELLVHVHQILIADQYAISDFVRADSAVLDIGANIGIFSIGAAGCAPQGKIFAFEPGGATYAALVKNVAPYPNVTTFHMALGEHTGEQTLFTPGDESAMASLDPKFASLYKKDEKLKEERVAVQTVDNIVQELGLTKLDVIKIDAEGSEMAILRGASRTIASLRPTIIVSAYHRPGDREEIPRFVSSLDSRYRADLMRRSEDDLVLHV